MGIHRGPAHTGARMSYTTSLLSAFDAFAEALLAAATLFRGEPPGVD